MVSSTRSSSTAADTNPDLDTIYPFAIQLAKDAGQMLMDALTSRRNAAESHAPINGVHLAPSEPTLKENAVDIVTSTDLAVEAFIHETISHTYPSHDFIGEETYSSQQSASATPASKPYLVTSAPTWIVDPLDGTVNFTHALPFFCVSIAFCVDGWPVVGVVYAPMLGQLFSACKGRGAWLNEDCRLPTLGKAVGPMPRGAPGRCVFGCEWGKQRSWAEGGMLRRKIESFVGMAASGDSDVADGVGGGMVHGVRSLGSATLDLCYVAMGGIDLWWEGGCWEWDVAAGICLVEEAGGLVTGADPPSGPENKWAVERCRLGSRMYLAVRPAVDDVVSRESARTGQERAVREVWRRTRKLGYERPGA